MSAEQRFQLLQLSDELLSLIVRFLPRHDLLAVKQAHPRLRHLLSPLNTPLWRQLYLLRFRHRRSQPSASITDPYRLCTLHLVSDAYYIHKHLPFRTIFSPPPQQSAAPLPLASPSAAALSAPPIPTFLLPDAAHMHIAHCRAFATVSTRVDRLASHTVLESAATSMAAHDGYVAVGMQNGAILVSQPHYHVAPHHVRGHSSAVNALTMHQHLIISASRSQIRVRHLQTRRSLAQLRGHRGAVPWLGMLGSDLLSYGAEDAHLGVWDLESGRCRQMAQAPGSIRHCAVHNGQVYVFANSALHVLDPRSGLNHTVAILSLPNEPRWRAHVGALHMAESGLIAVAVGSGGVAVWDARGTWQATTFGSPDRWPNRTHNRHLNDVHVHGECILAGGGAGELLTFSRDGKYRGLINENSPSPARISRIAVRDDHLVVASYDGDVRVAELERANVDWARTAQLSAMVDSSDSFFLHPHRHGLAS